MSFSVMFKKLEQKAAGVSAVALPLSLIIFTYEREIVPLYGSAPTTLLLETIAAAASLLAAVQPFQIPLQTNLLLTGISLTLAPNATYWVAVWSARRKDPVWGPAITHASVLAPLTFLLTTFVVEMDDPDAKPGSSIRPSPFLRVLRGTMTFLISFLLFQRVWYPSILLYQISGSQIYLALAGLFYGLWISSSSIEGEKEPGSAGKNRKHRKINKYSLSTSQVKGALLVIFGTLWFKCHHRFFNPVLPHPLLQAYAHPSYPLQILSAEQSVTGVITVAEWLPPPNYKGTEDGSMHSLRYLRSSHSLLGGVWIRDKVETLDNEEPVRDVYSNPLGDPIYAAFVLQEAALLVNSTEKGKYNRWRNALVIGLGAGTSASAFLRHGLSTTIVEIDPAVYSAARKWFGLPDPGPGKVFIEDARVWAANQEARKKGGLYDVVIHDCFSGGGVPEHIFTVEFWDDLKAVMAPDAVYVVVSPHFNLSLYSEILADPHGRTSLVIDSESLRLVFNTLERSIGRCRAFHDFEAVGEETYGSAFLNIVMFCTQSSEPLTFRPTTRSDWLGSPLRRFILNSLESREINLESIRAAPDDQRYILTDDNNRLGALQHRQGTHHWKVMREVLSDIHWETY